MLIASHMLCRGLVTAVRHVQVMRATQSGPHGPCESDISGSASSQEQAVRSAQHGPISLQQILKGSISASHLAAPRSRALQPQDVEQLVDFCEGTSVVPPEAAAKVVLRLPASSDKNVHGGTASLGTADASYVHVGHGGQSVQMGNTVDSCSDNDMATHSHQPGSSRTTQPGQTQRQDPLATMRQLLEAMPADSSTVGMSLHVFLSTRQHGRVCIQVHPDELACPSSHPCLQVEDNGTLHKTCVCVAVCRWKSKAC